MKWYAVVILLVVFPGVSLAGAVAVMETGQPVPVITGGELNVTGTDISNKTFPPEYALSPTPVELRVEVTATILPGPKGEMQAGPRSIGFAADPGILAILAAGIIALSAGVWFLIRKRPDEEVTEDEE